MWLASLEIAMSFIGISVLFGGKFQTSRKFSLEGRQARIAGVCLAAPLPVAFTIGLILGYFLQRGVTILNPESYILIDLVPVLIGIFGALFYAPRTKPDGDMGSYEDPKPLGDF